MEVHVFGESVLARVGAFPVTATMVSSLGVFLAVVLAASLLAAAARRSPESTPGVLAVLVVEWLDRLVTEIVGRSAPRLVALSGSLFAFVAAANLSGRLPGVPRPTASLAATSALACTVFLAVPIAGIATRGLSEYLKDYLRPNPLLLPLHLISELSRTVALAVRLFGNMMSGQLVVALAVALTGLVVPMPLMALDLLIGLLQAYIFTVLATVYVGAAIRAADA
ncbi:MAG: F0F1 ATP synthase subunit A [Thermodesulfobacteriota bacterium]